MDLENMSMTLYLIRHAQADEHGPKYPDDSRRSLIAEGRRQAKALAKALGRLEIAFDRLFSSPYIRALETAEPLAKRCRTQKVDVLSDLATSRYPQLITQLGDNLGKHEPVDKDVDNTKRIPSDELRVALVGHEPYLSELTSYLLTGDVGAVNLKFKKAMVVQLRGKVEAGAMTLHMVVPARVYKKL